MSHAGLDISDDAIRFIQYSGHGGSLAISKYGHVDLPQGLIEGGEVKDEKRFEEILSGLVRSNGLSYAKVSIPEEKAYLFETDVPNADQRSMSQNIEFKLKRTLPLSAADAVFTFDLLPKETGKSWRASVSAVQKSYIERMIKLLKDAGVVPISFETVPRAIARIVSSGAPGASIVIHCLSRKTGIYVVSEHAVGFTSTVSDGAAAADTSTYVNGLAAEIRRVYAYWLSKREAAGRLREEGHRRGRGQPARRRTAAPESIRHRGGRDRGCLARGLRCQPAMCPDRAERLSGICFRRRPGHMIEILRHTWTTLSFHIPKKKIFKRKYRIRAAVVFFSFCQFRASSA